METLRNSVDKVNCPVLVEHAILFYFTYCYFVSTGVEKSNHDARRNYFSSNLHDPTGEVLKAEGRLEVTSEYKREKRQYTNKTS